MTLTTEQLVHLASRFMGYSFPRDLSPDGGISIKYMDHGRPAGTNLMSYTQAFTMFQELAEGMPAAPQPQPATSHADVLAELDNRPGFPYHLLDADERLNIDEQVACMLMHTRSLKSLCGTGSQYHGYIEHRLRRISVCAERIRRIEDGARERMKAKQEAIGA